MRILALIVLLAVVGCSTTTPSNDALVASRKPVASTAVFEILNKTPDTGAVEVSVKGGVLHVVVSHKPSLGGMDIELKSGDWPERAVVVLLSESDEEGLTATLSPLGDPGEMWLLPVVGDARTGFIVTLQPAEGLKVLHLSWMPFPKTPSSSPVFFGIPPE